MNNYNSEEDQNSTPEFKPLPDEASLPVHLGADACPWLDEYIAFSRKWSPRSFDGYHQAVGLWVLSTIAARRVAFDFGKQRYTNLLIALIGRTSITAKSSAVQIGRDVLSKSGLVWLLLPDTITPQAMVKCMTLKLPQNYQELTIADKEKIQMKLAFAGQCGWYYEEFGQLISGMMRPDGPMADFRGLLRRFDDTEDRFENSTISRGNELVERPYLALLAIMTPADLAPHAKKGASLWGDGFLARMFVVSPPDNYLSLGRFPKGHRAIPFTLLQPLVEWHKRLGVPEVTIVGNNISPSRHPVIVLDIDQNVIDAYYAYDEALTMIVSSTSNFDLDGNYSRLPEKGLRMAALFASLENCPKIEIRHWARAQAIAEQGRKGLHDLYRQLNGKSLPRKVTDEDKVLRTIDAKGASTRREIEQYTGLKSIDAQNALDSLLDIGEIKEFPDGRTIRYIRSGAQPVIVGVAD